MDYTQNLASEIVKRYDKAALPIEGETVTKFLELDKKGADRREIAREVRRDIGKRSEGTTAKDRRVHIGERQEANVLFFLNRLLKDRPELRAYVPTLKDGQRDDFAHDFVVEYTPVASMVGRASRRKVQVYGDLKVRQNQSFESLSQLVEKVKEWDGTGWSIASVEGQLYNLANQYGVVDFVVQYAGNVQVVFNVYEAFRQNAVSLAWRKNKEGATKLWLEIDIDTLKQFTYPINELPRVLTSIATEKLTRGGRGLSRLHKFLAYFGVSTVEELDEAPKSRRHRRSARRRARNRVSLAVGETALASKAGVGEAYTAVAPHPRLPQFAVKPVTYTKQTAPAFDSDRMQFKDEYDQSDKRWLTNAVVMYVDGAEVMRSTWQVDDSGMEPDEETPNTKAYMRRGCLGCQNNP